MLLGLMLARASWQAYILRSRVGSSLPETDLFSGIS
jgi:hypothetical protein